MSRAPDPCICRDKAVPDVQRPAVGNGHAIWCPAFEDERAQGPGCATYKSVWFAGTGDGHQKWTFPCPYCMGHWT